MRELTCVDAFSGAGGLSLGLSAAGFEVLLGFDLDPLCVATSERNPTHIQHPVVLADVRAMRNGALLDTIGMTAGELTLLAGGPPCQGFSVQRTVGGDKDDRNLLVDEYAALVEEVRPKFFLMENVVGLGGRRGQAILQRFIARLQESGYFTQQRVIDAQHYGVPQRRRRLFCVGERLDGGVATFQWPVPNGSPPPTVRDAIGHLPPPPANGTAHPMHPCHRADKVSARNQARLLHLLPGQSRTSLPADLLAACHRMSADVIGHRNVYGRMAWNDVAPTITARFDSFTRGQFGHPDQLRSISLYEGALLQAFPPSFVFMGSKTEVARQIGNAVPPLLSGSLGAALALAAGRVPLEVG